MTVKINIAIPDVSSAEKSRLASNLHDQLHELEDVTVSIQRARPEAQDFGSVVELILHVPEAILAVQVISRWMKRKDVKAVKLSVGDRETILKGDNVEDVQKVTDLLKSLWDLV